jgi:hypothetical protein
LIIPCILTAFTHLWNPIGFPNGPNNDEGIYIRRAMHVLSGQGPQESSLYDHPYFGQLFLGSILALIGYPNSLNPSVGNVHSIEMLYFVPKILMGILAVADTFLIYKISECRYNRKVAFIASTMFAVMPITSWMLRRVWLEPIQLPFLLASILFAIYTINIRTKTSNIEKSCFVLIRNCLACSSIGSSSLRKSKNTLSLRGHCLLVSGAFRAYIKTDNGS